MTAQHYLAAGIDGDILVWHWLCNGHKGDDCRPDGECEVINFWHGMSDEGAYRNSPDVLDIATFTGRIDGQSFVDDPTGTDTLVFRMQNEYMELVLNGQRVDDVSCRTRQVAVVPVLTSNEDYVEHWGESEPGEPDGWLWAPNGPTTYITADDARWPSINALLWDYQGRQARTAAQEEFFRSLPA